MRGAQFSGARVDFVGAQFSGGMVRFGTTGVFGDKGRFYGAKFSGGGVDFSDPYDWSAPPSMHPPDSRRPCTGCASSRRVARTVPGRTMSHLGGAPRRALGV